LISEKSYIIILIYTRRRHMSVKQTAVIIDDDPVTLRLLEKYLLEIGWTVFPSDNGTEGYELIKREKPYVLISDMLLPGIHGVEICRQIKGDPELSQTKVIMMTSVYKNATYLMSDLECKRDGFLKKPIDLNELKEILEKI
jgi:sigma-B regulation protein RsbU (phosphoserine phosphatase)